MKASAEIRADESLNRRFRLGELDIEPRTGCVAGPGGREQLDPKVMAVLVFLAERAGQVVSHDDVISCVWPNTTVTDDALRRCLYELRRHLSQAGGDERYRAMLETLPRRGYRLNAEVKLLDLPARPGAGKRSSRRWSGLALVVAVAVIAAYLVHQRTADTSPASIAVMPFTDMSEEQDQGYLADGVAEEILNRLSQSEGLRVIARTSSFSLRGKDLDIAEIARKLNVTHVLEGSVRKSGDNVRVTAQLIAASDSSHLWSQTLSRSLGDLFAVQDEIAVSVASALRSKLVPAVRRFDSPASVEAQELYQRGNYFYYRREPGDIERASRHFEQAVNLDPGYARAWAALSGVYFLMSWDAELPSPALLARQGEAARRAVELAPELAVAQYRLFRYYDAIGDNARAREHLDKAMELDADEPLVLSAVASDAANRGDVAAAIELLQRTVALDPLGSLWRANLAELLLADGQLDAAMAQYRKIEEVSTHGDLRADLGVVRILILQGRYREAESALAGLPDGLPKDVGQAFVHAADGDIPRSDAALQRIISSQEAATSLDDELFMAVQLADVYAFRGKTDEAFRILLERKASLERRRGPADLTVAYLQYELRLSPFLKALHRDPRWAELIKDST